MDEALLRLEEFERRFPAEDIEESARRHTDPWSNTAPGYLVEMSSFLYPETSDPISTASVSRGSRKNPRTLPSAPYAPLPKTSHGSRARPIPPHLSYQSVYPLYQRLKELEDPRSHRVAALVKRYARALQSAEEYRLERERVTKVAKAKDARTRLIGRPGLGLTTVEVKGDGKGIDDELGI